MSSNSIDSTNGPFEEDRHTRVQRNFHTSKIWKSMQWHFYLSRIWHVWIAGSGLLAHTCPVVQCSPETVPRRQSTAENLTSFDFTRPSRVGSKPSDNIANFKHARAPNLKQDVLLNGGYFGVGSAPLCLGSARLGSLTPRDLKKATAAC